MTKVLDNTGLGYLITKIKAAFWPKSDVVTITLADVATTGSYNDLSNKPTIPTVPTISTDISADATSDTKTASPKAVKTYVDNAIPSVSGLESTSNKVTSLSSSSTDTQYPSAKCVYDLVGNIETLLAAI